MSSNGSNAGEIVFETESEEKMRIKKNGYVGIGTTNPSEKLDIEDTAVNQNAVISLSSNTAWSAMDFKDNGNFKWGVGKDQSNNFYISDVISGSDRLKIDYQTRISFSEVMSQ